MVGKMVGTTVGTNENYKRKVTATVHDKQQTTNMLEATARAPLLDSELLLDTTSKRFKDTLCIPDGFTYINCLAKGAHARIYLLARSHNGTLVVLKTPRVERSGIAKEYEFMNQIHGDTKHANVLAPIEFFADTESMLLEWTPSDVFTLVEKNGPMEEALLKTMACDVQRGLKFIHNLQIIHMDVKPENLLYFVDALGVESFKVADFGLSCEVATVLVEKPGSPTYAPPEVFFAGPLTVTDSIDMFSFGVTLYVASTGRLPWSVVSIHDKHFTHFWSLSENVRFARVPPSVVPFIKSTLCIDPSERNWAEVNNASQTVVQSLPAVAEDAAERPQCVVCLDAKCECVIVPCGHLCLCTNCANLDLKHCPTCRTEIQQTAKLFNC